MQSNLIRAGNRLAEIMPSQVGAEATITRIGTINTVYDTGGYWTADVDMSGGTLMGLQMTTDCVGARAGDRCVVETYAKVAIVTGILARPGCGCSPLFEWSSTWSGTPGTEPKSGYLEKTATVTWGVFLCFCQLLGELTCRDSGWLSWARFALPVASGVLSRVARFRLRGLVPGRGFRF